MNRWQRQLIIEKMGRIRYGPMLSLQKQRHAEVLAGGSEDTLFLLEHEPVITLGRNSKNAHVLVTRDELDARGVELYETGRGGDVTYHGPGQLVGYPILQLQPRERDVRRYVWRLEEIMIRAASDFGIEATRNEGKRGIWVRNAKLGAVGVRLARWTTMHGFALNVAAGIDGFSLIVPCGLRGFSVTSLERETGERITVSDVLERVAQHAADVLERELVAGSRSLV